MPENAQKTKAVKLSHGVLHRLEAFRISPRDTVDDLAKKALNMLDNFKYKYNTKSRKRHVKVR